MARVETANSVELFIIAKEKDKTDGKKCARMGLLVTNLFRLLRSAKLALV